jgi:hypothetical protein
VHQAVHQLPAYHAAAADARADGDIGEGVESLRGAPAPLRKSGAVDVGVEADRQIAECRPDRADHLSSLPAGLRRRDDRPATRSKGLKQAAPIARS